MGLTAKRKWAIAALVVLLVIVGGTVATAALRPSEEPEAVVGEPVRTRDLTMTVSVDGKTMATESATVYPRLSGTVERVYVEVGDAVEEGERLFTIEDTDVESGVLQAEATVAQARQTVAQAKQSRAQADQSRASAKQSLAQARAQELQAAQALDALESQPSTTPGLSDQIDLAEEQLAVAKAGVTTAKASLKTADAAVATAKAGATAARASRRSAQDSYAKAVRKREWTTVEAPVGGVISSLSVAEGASVSAGAGGVSASAASGSASSASAATAGGGTSGSSSAGGGSSAAVVISSGDDLEVRVQVNEADLPAVKLGQTALVTFDSRPDLRISAEVAWIAPAGTSSSGVITYDVDIMLDGQDALLRPNMSATADITTAVVRDALVVPNEAVKVDGTRKYVEVVGADGTARRVVVSAGLADARFTQITSGLAAGDEVVTEARATTDSGGGGVFGMMPGGD